MGENSRRKYTMSNIYIYVYVYISREALSTIIERNLSGVQYSIALVSEENLQLDSVMEWWRG